MLTSGRRPGSAHSPAITSSITAMSLRSTPAIPSPATAWRKAITRAQQHASHRQQIVNVLEAQQTRRGAPARRSKEHENATRPSIGGDRHRSAGWCVWRPALHPVERHHGHSARPPTAKSTTRRRCRFSGSTQKITTGRKWRAVRSSTPSCSRGRSRFRRPKGPANARCPPDAHRRRRSEHR